MNRTSEHDQYYLDEQDQPEWSEPSWQEDGWSDWSWEDDGWHTIEDSYWQDYYDPDYDSEQWGYDENYCGENQDEGLGNKIEEEANNEISGS